MMTSKEWEDRKAVLAAKYAKEKEARDSVKIEVANLTDWQPAKKEKPVLPHWSKVQVYICGYLQEQDLDSIPEEVWAMGATKWRVVS